MQQARLRTRLALVAMAAAAGCAAVVLHAEGPHTGQVGVAGAAPAAQAAPAVLRLAAQANPAARRIYPYSIVPGGVASRLELARAVMADKVVAAHYAGFAVDKADLRTVPRARAVYVSYRKGDRVYWTANKVMLAEGETVLSDGRNDIRARCGNRISDTPQLPVEVKGPSEQVLDTPVEQTRVDSDGALREVAFDPDDEGENRPFTLQSFPNGAGLLTAVQAQTGADRSGFGLTDAGAGNGGLGYLDALAGTERRQALLGMLASSASGLGGGKPDGGATTGGAGNGGLSGGGAADTGGGLATGGQGSHNAGDPPAGGATGGAGTGSTGGAGGAGTGTGGSNTGSGGDTGGDKPQDPTVPPDPHPDPLPDHGNPSKPHELPEPGSLWLIAAAVAALLLQRRLERS
jgi:hypothetical protein